jgi:hypothetical protein
MASTMVALTVGARAELKAGDLGTCLADLMAEQTVAPKADWMAAMMVC